MPSQTLIQPGKHIPQLDGIRGMAIIMVICYHYFPHWLLCNFGWTGVDLFFVLSGFLISSRLLPYLDDKKIVSKFYLNRLLRIVPLYVAFLSLFFMCWFLFVSKTTLLSYPFYSNHWWQFFLFMQNWVFIYDFPPAAVHLNHLWSLATEEQFYLVFPLFILLIKNRKKILIASVTLFILIILTRCTYFYLFISHNEYEKIYWNTFFRMDSFLAGSILYLLYERKAFVLNVSTSTKYLLGLIMLLLIAGIIINRTPNKNALFFTTVGYSIIAIVYAYFLHLALQKKNRFLNTLTLNRFMRYTGKISYGIYIFHWPVFLTGFTVMNYVFSKLHFSTDTLSFRLTHATCCILFTFIISHISYRYFESYFFKWKSRPGKDLLKPTTTA